MNLDLAKILFEEKDSNKLNKIFEEKENVLNDVEGKSRSQIEVLLNRFVKVLNGTLPKKDKQLKEPLKAEGKMTLSSLNTLLKRELPGNFYIDITQVGKRGQSQSQGITNADLTRYKPLQLFMFCITFKEEDDNNQEDIQKNLGFEDYSLLIFCPIFGVKTLKENVPLHKLLFNKNTVEGFIHTGIKSLDINDKQTMFVTDKEYSDLQGKIQNRDAFYTLCNQISKIQTSRRPTVPKKQEEEKPEEKPVDTNESLFYKSKLSDLLFEATDGGEKISPSGQEEISQEDVVTQDEDTVVEYDPQYENLYNTPVLTKIESLDTEKIISLKGRGYYLYMYLNVGDTFNSFLSKLDEQGTTDKDIMNFKIGFDSLIDEECIKFGDIEEAWQDFSFEEEEEFEIKEDEVSDEDIERYITNTKFEVLEKNDVDESELNVLDGNALEVYNDLNTNVIPAMTFSIYKEDKSEEEILELKKGLKSLINKNIITIVESSLLEPEQEAPGSGQFMSLTDIDAILSAADEGKISVEQAEQFIDDPGLLAPETEEQQQGVQEKEQEKEFIFGFNDKKYKELYNKAANRNKNLYLNILGALESFFEKLSAEKMPNNYNVLSNELKDIDKEYDANERLYKTIFNKFNEENVFVFKEDGFEESEETSGSILDNKKAAFYKKYENYNIPGDYFETYYDDALLNTEIILFPEPVSDISKTISLPGGFLEGKNNKFIDILLYDFRLGEAIFRTCNTPDSLFKDEYNVDLLSIFTFDGYKPALKHTLELQEYNNKHYILAKFDQSKNAFYHEFNKNIIKYRVQIKCKSNPLDINFRNNEYYVLHSTAENIFNNFKKESEGYYIENDGIIPLCYNNKAPEVYFIVTNTSDGELKDYPEGDQERDEKGLYRTFSNKLSFQLVNEGNNLTLLDKEYYDFNFVNEYYDVNDDIIEKIGDVPFEMLEDGDRVKIKLFDGEFFKKATAISTKKLKSIEKEDIMKGTVIKKKAVKEEHNTLANYDKSLEFEEKQEAPEGSLESTDSTSEEIKDIGLVENFEEKYSKLEQFLNSGHILSKTDASIDVTSVSEDYKKILETDYNINEETKKEAVAYIDNIILGVKDLLSRHISGKKIVSLENHSKFIASLYMKNSLKNKEILNRYNKFNIDVNPEFILFREDLGLLEIIKSKGDNLKYDGGNNNKYQIILDGNEPKIKDISKEGTPSNDDYKIVSIKDLEKYIREAIEKSINKEEFTEYRNKLILFLQKADTKKDINTLCNDYIKLDRKGKGNRQQLAASYNIEKALKNKVLSLLVEEEEIKYDEFNDPSDFLPEFLPLVIEMLVNFSLQELQMSKAKRSIKSISSNLEKINLKDVNPKVIRKVTNLLVSLVKKADPEITKNIAEYRKEEIQRRREAAERDYEDEISKAGSTYSIGGGIAGSAATLGATYLTGITGLGVAGAVLAAPVTVCLGMVIGPAAIIAGKAVGERIKKGELKSKSEFINAKIDIENNEDIQIDPTGLYNSTLSKYVQDEAQELVGLLSSIAKEYSDSSIEESTLIYKLGISLLLENEKIKSITLDVLKTKIRTISVGHQKMPLDDAKLERLLDERLYESCVDILVNDYNVKVKGSENLDSERLHQEMSREANIDNNSKVGTPSIPEIKDILDFLGVKNPKEMTDKINPLQFLLLMIMAGGENTNSLIELFEKNPRAMSNIMGTLASGETTVEEALNITRRELEENDIKQLTLSAEILEELATLEQDDDKITLGEYSIRRVISLVRNVGLSISQTKELARDYINYNTQG